MVKFITFANKFDDNGTEIQQQPLGFAGTVGSSVSVKVRRLLTTRVTKWSLGATQRNGWPTSPRDFKYMTLGLNDDREHITWFSFEGEFVGDYSMFHYGLDGKTVIIPLCLTHLFSYVVII